MNPRGIKTVPIPRIDSSALDRFKQKLAVISIDEWKQIPKITIDTITDVYEEGSSDASRT